MNYIKQINEFWTMNEIHCFNTNEISLYFYLLRVNNLCSWKQSFNHNNLKIQSSLNISFNTLKNARNRLKQVGILDFKTKNGSANTVYTLSNFDEVSNEVCSEVSNEVCSEVKSSKDKLNKTKLNNVLLIKEPKEKSKFYPPSLDEIKNEILEKVYKTVNANSFFNFYESKNWMVGKNKMKNWKMALAGWESRNLENQQKNQQNGNKQQFSSSSNQKQFYRFDIDKVVETYAGCNS